MKKLFVLSFASILLLTGCGATETLSCSNANTANNLTTKVDYDIDHEDGDVKKVRITYNYDFSDNNDNDVINNNSANNDANNNGNNIDTRNADVNGNDVNDNTGSGNNLDDGTVNNNTRTNDTNTNNDNDNDNDNHTDGVGTGTDGTTNDTEIDDDGVVDGVIGSAIDTIVGGVTSIILDSAGIRDRHATVQNTYGDINGFSVQNTNDVDDNYMVTYVIDYDTISDDDLSRLNLSRDLDTLRTNFVNQGFTCK